MPLADFSWPEPASPSGRLPLDFGPGADAMAIANLSAAAAIDDTLFLGGDEGAAIERLTLEKDKAGRPARFALADLLPLKDPDGEADVEGLAIVDDWLWVVGSHARTRPSPEKGEDERIDLEALADLKDTRPRCLLARIPLARQSGAWTPVALAGERRAALVRQTKKGSKLAKRLRKDPLLRPFTRLPAKEGGVDIEGIAVCEDRVALGLRGPVIAGHALLLEMKVGDGKPGRLRLEGRPARRLVALDGLGIRDLKRWKRDLLILAGPATALDAPCAVYRWRGWADDPAGDPCTVRLHRPEPVLQLPFRRGADHPEALMLLPGGRVAVLHDRPAADRLSGGRYAADLFDLALD